MKDIFLKNNIQNLKQKTLKKINKYNLCVVKNFINEKQIRKIFDILKKENKQKKDIRLSGKFIYGMKDYKRLDVGDSYKNPRFSRYIVLNEWNKSNKFFYEILKPLIDFRNSLANVKKEKFIYKQLNKNNKKYYFCDLIRMIQYPSGGGFLTCHNDYDPFYPKNMINMLLPITSKVTKFKDLRTYDRGGLYYKIRNKIFDIDKFIEPGDLIFHNQKIDHGVKSIDPYKSLNLNKLNGRVTINFSVGKFYLK